jgi:hypothetical protein
VPVAVHLEANNGWAAALDAVPTSAQGAVLAVAVVIACPPCWVLWMAIGWYEVSLTERVAAGGAEATTHARLVLRAQAALWIGIAVLCAVLGLWATPSASGPSTWTLPTRMAFLGPLVVAAAHGATARALRGTGSSALRSG